MPLNGIRLPTLKRHIKKVQRFLVNELPARMGQRVVRYTAFDAATDGLGNYVERQREHPTKALALNWLEQDKTLPERFSLLDVGCGPGVFAKMILSHPVVSSRIAYTGIDQSENALAYCRKTYHGDCRFLKVNLQEDELTERFDVISMHDVIEHLPHWDFVLPKLLALRPKVFVLSTFAVIPGLAKDRTIWKFDSACYTNSYSLGPLYQYLRSQTNHLQIADLGSHRSKRYWFPEKALLLFYLNLTAPKVTWTKDGWVRDKL